MSRRDPELTAAPEGSGPVPEEVEVRSDDHLHPADAPQQAPTRKKTTEILTLCFDRFRNHLFVAGIQADRECLKALSAIGQLIRMRFRCGEELQPVDRPQFHGKLRGAIDALLKQRDLLGQEARSALRGIDLDELAGADQQIGLLRELLESLETLSNRVRTKLAHVESYADSTVRTVHGRARSTIESNYDLSRGLQPVTDLISGGAVVGQETKKLTTKVAEDATERVIGRVKDAFNGQKNPAQPGGPPPKTPEEILATITSETRRDGHR